ncbi:MAG: PHP domain-containing protein [Candidatus Kuenenbacteria bacterium]
MYIDLHTHTIASDGILTPDELVKKAKKTGLSFIAKTDHDNVDLMDEFLKAGKKYGINTISGIEISSKYKNKSAHIVGLGIDYKDRKISEYSKKCGQARKKRALTMVKLLSKMGWKIKKSEIAARIITRPHVARAVLEHTGNRKRLMDEFGKIPNFSEFIQAYLAKDRAGYVKKSYYMPVKPAIRMIKMAGGLAILAHPKSKTTEFSYSQKHLLDLLKLKFDGIEVYSSGNTQAEINGLKKLAKKYGLLASAGSDYHGYDDEYPLGICNANGYAKEEMCEELLARLLC